MFLFIKTMPRRKHGSGVIFFFILPKALRLRTVTSKLAPRWIDSYVSLSQASNDTFSQSVTPFSLPIASSVRRVPFVVMCIITP